MATDTTHPPMDDVLKYISGTGQVSLAFTAAGFTQADQSAALADPVFAHAVSTTLAKFEVACLYEIRREGGPAGLRWLLERVNPDRYGVPRLPTAKPRQAVTGAPSAVENPAATSAKPTARERLEARRAAQRPMLAIVPAA